MIKETTIELSPFEAENESVIRQKISSTLSLKKECSFFYEKIKRSLDARRQRVKFILKIRVFIDEPFRSSFPGSILYKDIHHAPEVHIIGAGPAGLFCALKCIELGMKPVLFERGKNVKERRRDLARLNKEGELNPESNYCYGEGGAGTYSDGKLYTRSKKRGNVQAILKTFVDFGAEEHILYEAHPHIGTNKLPKIIEAIREKILECGGEIYFEHKLTDLFLKDEFIESIEINHRHKFPVRHLVLATGHSARDVYQLLFDKKIRLEEKAFALGVRIEHSQELINEVQYGKDYAKAMIENSSCALSPASYTLVEQVGYRGVFSFCMCPGGIIAPAATENDGVVVNGWSPSKRNNPYANSGLVVNVSSADFSAYKKEGVLAGMFFQKEIERLCFMKGGGKFVAPAQGLKDFLEQRVSAQKLNTSYHLGVKSTDLSEVLPATVTEALRQGLKQYIRKVRSYLSDSAILVATESRTSSPLRIPRDRMNLNHPQYSNLYPCAEGAGYAGGIVSAAIDGQNIAERICQMQKPFH